MLCFIYESLQKWGFQLIEYIPIVCKDYTT